MFRLPENRSERLLAILCAMFAGFLSGVIASEEAEEDWISAFGWIQTGQRLAESEHWPLAVGSLMEAHRKLGQMRERHPGYESEMVEYRIARLEEEIAAAREKLGSGDHALVVKFIDFAESFETGLEQRFDNNFIEAVNTLDVAKVLLDEIIFENPEEYRDAVASQYELLESSLSWLDSQINFRERERRQASPFVGEGRDLGTTEFVKRSDLPAGGDEILMSGGLFPGLLPAGEIVDAPGESAKAPPEAADPAGSGGGTRAGEAETGTDAPAMDIPRPTFRMSSRQKLAPELPHQTEAPEASNAEIPEE